MADIKYKDILLEEKTVYELCRYFPGGEGRVLWAIIILTNDNLKLQGLISLSHLRHLTHLTTRQIINCLHVLEFKGLVIIKREKGKVSTIRFQKYPEKWVVKNFPKNWRKQLQKPHKNDWQMSLQKMIEKRQGL